MTKLRKCPFCGEEATPYMASNTYCGEIWYVCCDRCGCRLGDFDTEAEAIEAWNKRTSCDTCAMYFPDDGCMAGLADGEVTE